MWHCRNSKWATYRAICSNQNWISREGMERDRYNSTDVRVKDLRKRRARTRRKKAWKPSVRMPVVLSLDWLRLAVSFAAFCEGGSG